MSALDDVLEELSIKNASDTTLLYMDKRVTDSMAELINSATEELAQIRNRIAEFEVRTTWQPIESAPKDGRYINLYSKHFGIKEGCWLDGAEVFYAHFCQDDYKSMSKYWTHWMPIPASPK
jgi:hypothetical protein